MQFSTEQLVSRFEDQRQLRNIMGKLSYLGILKREKEIFSMFWSTRDDICLGVNEGWYLGPQAVAGYYQAFYDRALYCAKFMKEHFPKQTEGKSEDELYGAGIINIKPVDTAVIEVAGDGLTAQGVWYCRGSDNDLKSCGPANDWSFGCYAVDFIKEGSDWKIWHMQYLEDIRVPAGKTWGKAEQEFYPDLDAFKDVEPFNLPAPTVAVTLMERYTPSRPFTKLPEPPVPYWTYAEASGYGYKKED